MKLVEIDNYLGSIKLALNPLRDMEKIIIEGGLWSPEMLQAISFFVRENDCVLDVGANSGLITLPLARAVGESGRVVAFEPDTTSLEYFRRNLSLNPILARRVTTVELLKETSE